MAGDRANEKPARGGQLRSELIELASAVTRAVFSETIPQNWSSTWLDLFHKYDQQERAARSLLSDFSRNRQGVRGQQNRAREFLKSNGIDPDNFDMERDFGAWLDLSPTAAELFRVCEDDGAESEISSLPVAQLKQRLQAHGGVMQPSWSNFVLSRFRQLANSAHVERPPGWILDLTEEMQRAYDAPPHVHPSDTELAAISIEIFADEFPKLGIALVTYEDNNNPETASSLLGRHAGRIRRARRDMRKRFSGYEYYDGDSMPSADERGVRDSGTKASLPWPQQHSGKSFSELAAKPL